MHTPEHFAGFSHRAAAMAAQAIGKRFTVRARTGDAIHGTIVDCSYARPAIRGRTVRALFKVSMLVDYRNDEGRVFTLRREYHVTKLPR